MEKENSRIVFRYSPSPDFYSVSKIDSLVRAIRKARLEKKSILSLQPQKVNKIPIDILMEEMESDSSFTSNDDTGEEVQLSITQSQDNLAQLNGERFDDTSDPAGVELLLFETTAEKIRSNLLKLTRSATMMELKIMSDSIAALIQKVGANFGADGIMTIGSIITKRKSNSDAQVGDPLPPFLISDNMVSNLSKSCVTGETSAVRASAFIYSFILPHVDKLKELKSGPPSRVMISTISILVRDRHLECVESLFVPTLCRIQPPSKAQCELVCRIIKSIAIPKDSISLLVSKFLLNDSCDPKGNPLSTMKWSDHLIPIITSCLLKRPILDDRTIVSLTQQILSSLKKL